MFMLPSLLRLQFQSATVAQVQPSGEEEQEEDTVAWVNAAVGRIFWDFLSEPHWAELVSKKIQMKLSKIRVSERGLARPLTLQVVQHVVNIVHYLNSNKSASLSAFVSSSCLTS